MEGWMPLPETEPPAGPVLLVVIARTVRRLPSPVGRNRVDLVKR